MFRTPIPLRNHTILEYWNWLIHLHLQIPSQWPKKGMQLWPIYPIFRAAFKSYDWPLSSTWNTSRATHTQIPRVNHPNLIPMPRWSELALALSPYHLVYFYWLHTNSIVSESLELWALQLQYLNHLTITKEGCYIHVYHINSSCIDLLVRLTFE